MNRLFNILTISLGLFPILKLNHYSILMIVWFICAVYLTISRKIFRKVSFSDSKKYVYLILPVVFYLVSFPFVSDKNELIKIIVKTLPLLLFPIGFVFTQSLLHKNTVQYILYAFVIAVIGVNLLGWISVFSFGFFDALQKNDFYHPVFRNLFTESTQLHIPYLGFLTAFSALLLVYYTLNFKKHLIVVGLLIVFLTGSLYIYSARMALVIFVLGLFYVLFHFNTSKKLRWLMFTLLPLTLLVAIWFSPMKQRFEKMIETEWVLPHADQQPHEVNYRYAILYCSSQIFKENVWFGVGADQVQHSLNKCYEQFTYRSYEDFTQKTYNTHNQYFDWILKFGIIGGLILIVGLFYYLPNSTHIYQLFLGVVLLTFLTENVLDRQIGVVFYSLFQSVFVILKKNFIEKDISS